MLVLLLGYALIFHTSAKSWPPQSLQERVPNIIEKIGFLMINPTKRGFKVIEAKKTTQYLKRLNFLHF